MFYSASSRGFYDREIHGNNIPPDAVDISAEQHAALLDGQSQGKIIVSDESGYPVLADPPQQTKLLPISATPFQFRKALNASGLRSAVEAYISSASQDIKDGYEFATEFRSDDPMVLAAAAAVGKTPDEAYEFIVFAKTL